MEDWHWNYVLRTCNFVAVIAADGKVTKTGSMADSTAFKFHFRFCVSVSCVFHFSAIYSIS